MKIEHVVSGVNTNTLKDQISSRDIVSSLKKYMLVDGFDVALDLEKSKGAYIYDAKRNKNYLDFFTFVASNPLGMNHPKLYNDDFIRKIGEIAVSKPSLSDIYTKEQEAFVSTFFRVAVPDYFKHSFYIEGGSLAVENAIKAAMDWKVQKNFKKGYSEEKGSQVIHFQEAFHGRSGYTLSLTNTDPTKTKYFPKFDWPRIINPKINFPLEGKNLQSVIALEEKAISQIKDAIKNNKDDIAALILEPIQGEGGDNQFRKEFFVKLREICDEEEIMFILDEVQTGIAMTGKWWAHQHFIQPDMIAFGKKTQVCGFLSTNRIDEVEENVFAKASRINSTWGGNIVDMFRFKKFLEIIEEDNLVDNAAKMGEHLMNGINHLIKTFPDKLSNPRGLGLFCAFDCENKELRNNITAKCFDNGLMILGSGEKGIRFRTALNINRDEINEGIGLLEKSIKEVI